MESADTQTGGERGSCRRGNKWEKFGALFAQRAFLRTEPKMRNKMV